MNELMRVITQDDILQHQEKRHDVLRGKGATDGELDWLVLESVGGPCPKCRKPWEKVTVSNRYAAFEYYRPACECYETCAECGKSLYGHVPAGFGKHQYKCPSCGHREPPKWRLTCVKCGQNGTDHEGKPYAYVCPECKKRQSKYKRDELA